MDMRFPARVQRPEERELELKRQELAAVEADLVEQELHLSTLQAEFAAFKAEYLRVVGVRYAELDGIKARIAELRATQAPSDGAAQTAASKARATAESSAAEAHDRVSREPTSPFDPPVEFKTLYRTIARRLHPDLAATDKERAYRHEWMAKVNDAYQRQDSEALAALLSAWETSPESVSGTGVSSDLVRVIRQIAQVRRRLDSIRRAIQALQAGALYTLHQKCNVRSDAGGSPLEEMAASLDNQINAARQELAVLEAGVSEDPTKAATWYRLAAEQGDAAAQFNLGVMYEAGQGVPQDDHEAVRWYRLAAEQGDAAAQFNLGVMYEAGQGVPQDDSEAVRWYRRAAEQGDTEAQYWLGHMYYTGRGVLRDHVAAHKWATLAGAGGQPHSLREHIAKRMTAGQIAAAQRAAQQWRNRRTARQWRAKRK